MKPVLHVAHSRAVVLIGVSLLAPSATAQSTARMSVASGGAESDGLSLDPAVSADGRFVAFWSEGTNLVPGDTNASRDVFLYDRQSATTVRVSVDSGGTEGNSSSSVSSISSDGRFIAFFSHASNLVTGDANATPDIFVRDTQFGTTERVSVSSAGVEGNSYSNVHTAISADGRFVAFISNASNLVTGDTNGIHDAFVRDRLSNATERVSLNSAGIQIGASDLSAISISSDGRFVAFRPNNSGVSVRDRWNGTTELISVTPGGAASDGENPSISPDGRFVAFESYASNLVAGDTNGFSDVFVRDRLLGTTDLVSLDSGSAQGNNHSYWPSVSADGRFVAFSSRASNLVGNDTNGAWDVLVHDRQFGTTERVSVGPGGIEGNGQSGTFLLYDPHPVPITSDGRLVAFYSGASNLVANDVNALGDVFIRDRGTPGTDLCQPGTSGVLVCPCSNPPGGAPRGCDNSAATGGAQLTSNGTPSLAVDNLVFVTNGEKPTATSIVLQGNVEISTGLGFGQGVRCAGGSLKRLYVKTASGGSISAPGPGDVAVSVRSATLGDLIVAGTSRWYAVYYRDPVVLGGCPSTNTFNITQTQLVTWGP